MCIALLTTTHPHYPLILLNNRDEFLSRPTAPAHWWDDRIPTPDPARVLGGRDLFRPERGSWLALSASGRLAVLTNFREEGVEAAAAKSRGAIVGSYVRGGEGEEEFARRWIEGVGIADVGGFSLIYGELGELVKRARGDGAGGLAVLSNRSRAGDGVRRILEGGAQTEGLSNNHFDDATWPKVREGKALLEEAVKGDVGGESSKREFLDRLFDILSVNRFPTRADGESWQAHVRQMRNSIFIPRVGGPGMQGETGEKVANAEVQAPIKFDEGFYGTQKQTVLLVDNEGQVTFVERTLHDENGDTVQPAEERAFEFKIEG